MNFEPLSKLLKEKRWDEFEMSIKENETEEFLCGECCGSHTLLHHVCQYKPPHFLVNYLVAKSPNSCLQIDCKGRLPLHVAIMNRASNRVIMILLSENKAAASKSTKEGKYPLHLLFESCSEDTSSCKENVTCTKQCMKDLDLSFRYICKVAPETVVIEDEEGINPIEYAIENEVDISMIRRMGRIAYKVNSSRRLID